MGRQASGVDFSSGAGYRDIAQAAERAGDVLTKIQEQTDGLEYHKQITQFQLGSMQASQRLNQSEIREGSDLVKEYESDFKQRWAQLKIPETMQNKASEDMDSLKLGYMQDAIQETARQTGIKARDNWETIVTTNSNIVAMNPAMQSRAMESIKQAADGLNLDPATRQALLHDGVNAIRSSAADIVSRSNPGAFLSQAKAGKWNDLKNLSQYVERVQAGQKEDIRAEAGKIEDAAKLGLSVPRENIEALAIRASGSGMEKEAKGLREYAEVQDSASVFAVKSMTEQKAELLNMKAAIEKGDLSGVHKYSALSNVFENKIKVLESDPWAYYSAHGIVKEPQPIDLRDQKSVGNSLRERRIDIARIRDLEGGFTMPLLTKTEIGQIKEINERGDARQAAEVITALGSGLDHDERRALSQAIVTQADSPLMAAALNQPRDIAERILNGAKAKGDVSAAKVRESVNAVMGGSILDPEADTSIHDSIYAYYKELSLQEGDTSKEPNPDRIERSIEDVVGKTVSISPKLFAPTSKIFTYRDENGRSVDENDIEDILGGITDDVLKKVNGDSPYASDGEVVPAEEILKNARFVSVGDGIYNAIYPGLGVVHGRDGNPYTFDARKIEKVLKDSIGDYKKDTVKQGVINVIGGGY